MTLKKACVHDRWSSLEELNVKGMLFMGRLDFQKINAISIDFLYFFTPEVSAEEGGFM